MDRKTMLTLATALALALPTLAAADALDDIRAAGVLRAAVDLGSPPFGMTDAQMQPTGSEVESARLLADHLGVDLQIVQVTSPNRIPFLLTGKADVVAASLSVTPERREVIDFADPHGVIPIVVAAPAGVAVTAAGDLDGLAVATTRGSTNDQQATADLTGADIVRYDDDATLVTAVVSGQNDIIASSPMIMAAINQRREADPLEAKLVLKVNPYAIGVRKDEPALVAAINEWVAQDLANGKLREIYRRYNGIDLPADMPQ